MNSRGLVEITKYYLIYTTDKKIKDALYNNICYNSLSRVDAEFSAKQWGLIP